MSIASLLSIGLVNAVLATVLAMAAFAAGRYWRRPALAHLLWVIVLLKLLTPPVVEIPVGWTLDDFLVVAPHLAPSPTAQIASDSQYVSRPVPLAVPDAAQAAARDAIGTKAGETNVEARSQPAKQTEARKSPLATGTSTPNERGFARAGFIALQAWIVAFLKWLPAIWIGGIAIHLFVLVRRTWAFRRFVHRAGNDDPVLSRRVRQLAQNVGLSTVPRTIVVDSAVSPMLWGAGGSVQLIFPARLARELAPAARDALLLHELAHYSRGDQWVRLVELTAKVLYWWHPVAWWAGREIEAAEEQCCDAWVVERQSGSRRSYAEALLATIDFLCEEPALLPPAASGLGEVPLLRIRLTQIMCGDVATGLPASIKAAVLIIALVILPLGPALFGASVRPIHLPPATKAKTTPSLAAANPTAPEAASVPSAEKPSSISLASAVPPSLVAMDLPIAAPRPTAVTASAISPNGKHQLQRRKGSHVTLVNQATNWRLDMSTHGILCVAFTPDSRLFVTGHEDSFVRIWDSETGGLTTVLKGCTDAVWSVATCQSSDGGNRVAGGARDGSVVVWDIGSSEEVARLPAAEVSVSCLRWSEQGDKLAVSIGDFSDNDQAGLLIWSPYENALLAEVKLDKPVAALTWLRGESHLAVADWKGETKVWKLAGESLGDSGQVDVISKQAVESANWSADCPLIPAWRADQLAGPNK